MSWLHGKKTRHEQQKEPSYLKNKPFLENLNFFCNAYKELSKNREKNPLIFRVVFRKCS